jgi:glycosyltransferase involved in cell wall biosynthesis
MAKILKSYGLNVAVLSSVHYQDESFQKKIGRHNGIKYFMPSVHPSGSSVLQRYLHKLIYIIQVLCFVIYLKKKWSRVHFIFDDNSTPFPFLLILSWLGIIELIFNLEEWPIAKKSSLGRKFISHLFVLLAFKSCNKFVCVSSYLEAKAKHYNKAANVLKLPALADFSNKKLNSSNIYSNKDDELRFLYCGNVGYSEVIFAIIEAYEKVCMLNKGIKLSLILILHGSSIELNKIADYISSSKYLIEIKTFLSEINLYKEYFQASVLLAPLRLTVQDEARFPQKIAEYTVLGKPIITTNVGDIKQYFKSEKSAFFLNNFSVDELMKAMNFFLDNKQNLEEIGHRSNLVGKQYFNYKQYIYDFGDFVIL